MERTEAEKTEMLGKMATVCANLIWLSQLDQIHLNLTGHKGSWIMPLAIFANCIFWTLYGSRREDRAIVRSNVLGIILAPVNLATVFFF